MKYIFIFLIYIYKIFFAWINQGKCHFLPSCSDYSLEAFQKFGAIKGLYLTIHRLARCNPYSNFAYDPVPNTFQFRRKK